MTHQAPSSIHEILQARIWSGLPFPSLGDLPDLGIEARSATLQADSLPPEPPGKVTLKWQILYGSEVAQSCPTLRDPLDCSPPGSSVHGILQARILEWVAISFSRGSSQPRDQTQVSCIRGRRFNLLATREGSKKIFMEGP